MIRNRRYERDIPAPWVDVKIRGAAWVEVPIKEIRAGTGGFFSKMMRATKVSVDSPNTKEALSNYRIYSSPKEKSEQPFIN